MGKLFKEKDDKITHVYYPNFSQALVAIDDSHLQRSKQIERLVLHLNSQLRDVFEMERENYQKVYKEVRENYVRYAKKV